ncbi:hypothetical protein [Geomonas sp.]|uniref:hypothetical protein n=1 Tax=Geomonas sp. TaxID=2651584 RepID=UPI002B470C3E|nr:hypothetical protein [Geomonas sp.]HJV35333.1 hypothetical protein [Geomonas sp.]
MKKSVLTGLVAAGLLASTGSAWATTAKTAANTQIVNTATINFTIGSTNSSASASVAVTVSLIPSAPQVSISNPAPVAYTGPNTPVLSDTLTITSTANGPATYTIGAGINASVNNGNTATASATATSIVLGASVTSQATTASNVLYVPSVLYTIDPTLNSATEVNGLTGGKTIVFTDHNGVTQTVAIVSVSNPGTATGTATITLANSYTVDAGTPVYEQSSSININVLPGTVALPGTFLTVDASATVSGAGFSQVTVMNSTSSTNANAGDPSKAPTNLNVWTSAPATVNITKYVRNVSNPNGGCSVTITGTTGSWCPSGVVTGKSGDNLEYAVIAKNNATDATGNLSNCNITDLLPPSFVTLACNGYTTGVDVNYIDTGATVHTLQACGNTSGQWANWNPNAAAGAPNLLVYVGNGAGAALPGVLPFGQQVVITYKATIK